MSASKVVMKIVSFCFSILIVILLVMGFYRGGKWAFEFGHRVFTETAVDLPEDGQEKVVEITPGMGAMELGDLLEKKGLIRDSKLFFLQLKLSSFSNKMKEGIYTLSTSMTAYEMMQVMSASEIEDTETEE